jgi:hypothetical protein
MDELETLYDVWEAPEPPPAATRARARSALLARATAKAERRGYAPIAAVGGSALAIVVAVSLVETLGGTSTDGRPALSVPGFAVPAANAAQALERAAVVAERKPFTAPRDDQWFYFEDRHSIPLDADVRPSQTWRKVDGTARAWIGENGKLQVRELELPTRHPARPTPVLEDYRALAALPADPDLLLRWAHGLADNITGAGLTEHGDVYSIFNHILRDNVLPPRVEAAIFRALKQVPGVTVIDDVDALGRPAFALGQTEDWLHEELLLDKETYEYRGERSTVVENAVIDPLKAGNSTGRVTKGARYVFVRVVTAVVDAAGQRP